MKWFGISIIGVCIINKPLHDSWEMRSFSSHEKKYFVCSLRLLFNTRGEISYLRAVYLCFCPTGYDHIRHFRNCCVCYILLFFLFLFFFFCFFRETFQHAGGSLCLEKVCFDDVTYSKWREFLSSSELERFLNIRCFVCSSHLPCLYI